MYKKLITNILVMINVIATLALLIAFGIVLYYYISASDIVPSPEQATRLKSEHKKDSIKFSFNDIELQLNKERKTEYYELKRVVDISLDDKQEAKYYLIDLKHPTLKEVIHFDAGKFTLEALDYKLIESLDNLYTCILDRMDSINYQVYIEGEADIAGDLTFYRVLDPSYKYKSITYHPSNKSKDESEIIYSSQTKTKYFTDTIRNKDLPLLRANYLKQKFKKYDRRIPDPILLEGGVRPIIGEKYRNGKIYLCIDSKKIN